MKGAAVSIVIPACNEAEVLPLCLGDLLAQEYCGRFRIVIVANGCHDDTVTVAQSWRTRFEKYGHMLDVLEVAQPGKARALNAGEALLNDSGVRIYLDADVRLSPNALHHTVESLAGLCTPRVCAPRLSVAPSRSRITAAYSRIWARLPYVVEDVIGCGFYAVNTLGRRRWGAFPNIISDDKYVRLQFCRAERSVVRGAWFRVQMPEGLSELIRIRSRWCRGNSQLRRRFPELAAMDSNRHWPIIRHYLIRPEHWLDLVVFVIIYTIAGTNAYLQTLRGYQDWNRACRAREVIRSRQDAKHQPVVASGP